MFPLIVGALALRLLASKKKGGGSTSSKTGGSTNHSLSRIDNGAELYGRVYLCTKPVKGK
jgi:hypothetical protein